MENFVNGLIGVVLVSIFLFRYLVELRSFPFALIVLGVLALVFIEFYQTVKKGNGNT